MPPEAHDKTPIRVLKMNEADEGIFKLVESLVASSPFRKIPPDNPFVSAKSKAYSRVQIGHNAPYLFLIDHEFDHRLLNRCCLQRHHIIVRLQRLTIRLDLAEGGVRMSRDFIGQ